MTADRTGTARSAEEGCKKKRPLLTGAFQGKPAEELPVWVDPIILPEREPQ